MPIFLLLLFLLPRSECLEGLVIGVNDGDTITILVDSQAVRVRLYGIDCPEKGQDFAGVAKRRVSTLCYDSIVTVQIKGKDRYGRTLGYVILGDGQILNHVLVEEGLAWWFRRYSPQDRVLKALEQKALKEKKGIWSTKSPISPWEFRATPREKTVGQGAR